MKLVSFVRNDRAGYGLVVGNGVIDLSRRLGERFSSLHALLALDGLPAASALARAAPDFDLADMRFTIPIRSPDKILCIGVNYANRNAEYKDGTEPAKYPSLFMRTPGSFVGHREAIVRPPESVQLDYEGEIAIIIGRAGRRIAEADATSHIAGLTCMNEGTIRDWLRHGKFNVTQGKNFDQSGAMGPWMVTADEFTDGYENLSVTTRVNGEVRQQDTTANLMFSFANLIHYISTWTTLRPGDVIATGTPIGAGVRFDPPRFLQAGDVVEVEVDGIGTLANTVSDEQP